MKKNETVFLFENGVNSSHFTLSPKTNIFSHYLNQIENSPTSPRHLSTHGVYFCIRF